MNWSPSAALVCGSRSSAFRRQRGAEFGGDAAQPVAEIDRRQQRRPAQLEALVERFARQFDPELARLDVGAQFVRLVGVIEPAHSRAERDRRAALKNFKPSDLLYSGVVIILVEMGDMLALATHRLRRNQRVGERHVAKSHFADKAVIVGLLLGRAIDLEVDFTDGVAPRLPALGGRQRSWCRKRPSWLPPQIDVSGRAVGSLCAPAGASATFRGSPRRRLAPKTGRFRQAPTSAMFPIRERQERLWREGLSHSPGSTHPSIFRNCFCAAAQSKCAVAQANLRQV